MSTHRRQHGFTIIELVTVVLVMGILAAIALPSNSVSTKRKLDTLQLQIQDALDYAQLLAYHTPGGYAVSFQANEQWFGVLNQSYGYLHDPLTRKAYKVRIPEPGQPSGVRLESANFGAGGRMATFDDKGVLENPGTVVISADGVLRVLSIDTATAKLAEVPISE